MYSGVGKKVPMIRSNMQYEHMLRKAEENALNPEEREAVLEYEKGIAASIEADKITPEWIDNVETPAFKTVQVFTVDYEGKLKFMLTTIKSEDFICELTSKTHAREALYAIGGSFKDPSQE